MSLPNSNSYDILGGELNDYAPVTDPTTDLSAESSNEMRSDVAAMTRMTDRAWVAFTIDGYSVPQVANNDFDAVWGNALAYKPEVEYNDVGDYTVTFPEEVVDARGIEQTVNLRCGHGNCESLSFTVNVKKLSPNSFSVKLWAATDGPLDPDPITDKVHLFVK